MGVMVPAAQIVKKAIEVKADMIGLSGLITPSLEEMVGVATEMAKAGLDIPIMIGGATTSQLHVALKIAPVYKGPVVWMKDASQNALVAAKLMNKQEERQMQDELNEKYDKMRQDYFPTPPCKHIGQRQDYEHQQQEIISLQDARNNKLNLFEQDNEN